MVAASEDTDRLKGDPHRSQQDPARKDSAMDAHLLDPPASRLMPRHTEPRNGLVACSICLRVLRGSEWIEAERVIRTLRSYELEAPPRLGPGVCDVCAESIVSRRARVRRLQAA
jgi:hypothetical protein